MLPVFAMLVSVFHVRPLPPLPCRDWTPPPQSFSEYMGIGGGYGTAHSSGLARSTNSGNGGGTGSGSTAENALVAAAGSPPVGSGVGTAACDSEGGVEGGAACCTTRRWESAGKKLSSSTGARRGARQAVDQGSGFVRDFVRGAGIHRLDPRRLAGKGCLSPTHCCRRTGICYLLAWGGARL